MQHSEPRYPASIVLAAVVLTSHLELGFGRTSLEAALSLMTDYEAGADRIGEGTETPPGDEWSIGKQ
jgi:hypothetical protein